MNRDEVKGKAGIAKGKVKKAVGEITNDPDLQDEGVADETTGRVRDAFGRSKRKTGEVLEEVGKAVKR